MSNSKMREEFEVAVLRDWPQAQLRRCDTVSARAGQYADERIQHTWWGWQASREALVIELPSENPLGSGPGDHGDGRPSFEQHCAAECNFILRDCRDAIEAAGLKVKS